MNESESKKMSNGVNKRLLVLAGVAVAIAALAMFLMWTSAGTSFVWGISNQGAWLLPLVVVSALLDSINPCAFSILILTIAFLFSLGRARSGILTVGASYIAGNFAVYLMIGLGLIGTLHLFSTPHFMAKVGATLLVLFGGLNLIGEFFPAFPIRLRIPQAAHAKIAVLMERASVPAAFGLGALVGLCEFPCTGGPYLMVLGLLHDAATFWSGFGYLILYNIIFIVPLVVLLLIASEQSVLTKVQTWKKAETGNMRIWGAIAMIALGAIIFLL